MSSIKIYPPNQLPAEGISDVQFEIWREELEVYLEIENKFRKFLPGGRYETWTPAETDENRILAPVDPDKVESMADIRRELRQFVTIVAKYVHMDYYNPIVRHSSSLQWIYTKIREDYDIQRQGIHFFNILDLTWDSTAQTTPVGFYNQYRSMIIGNLAKKSTVIDWKGETLKEDEKLTPSHEDLILMNVLQLLHPKLPSFIREQYAHKIGLQKRLMDFKTEILTKAKQYIEEIETPQAANIILDEEPQCNYIQQQQHQQQRSYSRGNWRGQNSQRRPQTNSYHQRQQTNSYPQRQRPTPSHQSSSYQSSSQQSSSQPPPFCRVCQVSGLSRTIYTSHYLGQASCPSLSARDKQLLTSRINQQLNAVQLEDDEDDLAKEYGYDQEDPQQLYQQQQVNNDCLKQIALEKKQGSKEKIPQNVDDNDKEFSTFHRTACNFIQPIPTQTLTVQDANNADVHLDLDSGATVSYVKLSAVLSHGFQIKPNSQLSNLAD